MFPTTVRLSGTAIGTQIGFALGGFAPTVAEWIAGDGPHGWIPVATLVLGATVVAALAAATARETCRVPLDVIDGVRSPDHQARFTRARASTPPTQRSPSL
jgi:hypothetical protein